MCRPWTVGVAYVTVGTGRSAATRRPTTARSALAHLRRGDRGAAAVEFALIVPVLLVVVFGIIDFGLLMNSSSLLSNAAREGARVASLGGSYDATVAAAKSTEQGLIGTVPTPTATCILSGGGACPGGASGWAAGNSNSAPTGASVTVSITYAYTWITPIVRLIPGWKSSITISRASTMRVE